MKLHKPHFFLLLLCCLPLFSALNAIAKPDIPDSLKEWVPWVLHNQEKQACTASYSGKMKSCVWPEPLQMNLNARGGIFSQRWEMEKSGWILLPGNDKHWPQDVLINNISGLVVEKNGHPALYVESSGTYEVTGQFRWQSLPEAISVPEATGLVSPFVLHGKVETATITSGTLWLSKRAESDQQEQDAVQTHIYRHITDTIPMVVTTHITLKVSGKPRELIIDWDLPENQIPIELRSLLPVKIGTDNKIHIQARPGNHTVIYTYRITGQVETIHLGASTAGPNTEYWSFESRNNLRIVKVSGLPAVDPSQTSIPQKWHTLPAYLVTKGDTMHFETIKRGDTEPAPNNFRLLRKFWLDSSGEGITVQDFLTGVVHKNPRLEMQNPGKLGRVTINGQDQLITKLDKDGVEVRQGHINAEAVSRLEGVRIFPAGGWEETIDDLSAELLLQPGWKLFHAQGLDSTRSWISSWTLLDCFVVLIIAIACFRILGTLPSLAAFIALVFSYHDQGAPVFIWLGILACIALIKTAPHLKHIRIVKAVKLLLFVILIMIVLPFSVQQLRQGIYPQLERSNVSHRIDVDYSVPQVQRDVVVKDEELIMSTRTIAEPAAKLTRMAGTPVSKTRETIQQFNTQSKVQSGPGVPNRAWNQIPLKWNGPVDADLNLKLYLISPLFNMLLVFLKIAAIFILMFFMIRPGKSDEVIFNFADTDKGKKGVAALILLFTISVFTPAGAHAGYPPKELLDTLQARLLEPAECFPHCADFDVMDIRLTDKTLLVEITAHSIEDSAVSLPTGKGIHWQSIVLNKEKTPVLLQNDALWLPLPKGSHQITMRGQVSTTDVQFTMEQQPHLVHFKSSDDWSVAGLDANGVPAGQIQFIKQEKEDGQNFGESALPPHIKIERVLHLDVEWRVSSTVTRVSPPGTSVYLNIPLLDGESVTDERYKVSDKSIEIHMGPKVQTMQWTSVLKETSSLTLVAPDTTKWSEIWKLNASPIWHVEAAGIPVIQYYSTNATWQPQWHPWPNEQITLTISRPPGIAGETKTIESSKLKIVPGLRSTTMELSLVVRSTRGDQQNIRLPDDIVLQAVKINDQPQPIKIDTTITIPITPGSQDINIKMNSPKGINTLFKVPEINLGTNSVNSEVEIQTGARWVWFVQGPQTGPAILFYSELLIILIAAVALGISKLTPLSSIKWIILGLGLSQSGLVPALIIVLWFVALTFRKKSGATLSGGAFNALQIFLIALTVVSFGAIMYAIQHGLLGHPDMQIVGNNSNSYYLRWYQDHIGGILPQPLVISVPILVYRILMLLWALWLAFNILSWVRWGWQCVTTGKYWDKVNFRRKQKEVKK